jgi:hypothetical protein
MKLTSLLGEQYLWSYGAGADFDSSLTPETRQPLIEGFSRDFSNLAINHNEYAPINEFQLERLSEVASSILSSLRKAKSSLNEDSPTPNRPNISSGDPRHQAFMQTISTASNVFDQLEEYVQQVHFLAVQTPSDATLGPEIFDRLEQISSYVCLVIEAVLSLMANVSSALDVLLVSLERPLELETQTMARLDGFGKDIEKWLGKAEVCSSNT